MLNRNTVSDLELVVPELVTNSVEHGRGTIRPAVEHSIYEIHAPSPTTATRLTPLTVSRALHRRGLAIVDALITR